MEAMNTTSVQPRATAPPANARRYPAIIISNVFNASIISSCCAVVYKPVSCQSDGPRFLYYPVVALIFQLQRQLFAAGADYATAHKYVNVIRRYVV